MGIKSGTVVVFTLLGASVATADPRDRAKMLHDRLAGVPPSNVVLDQMEALIESGDFAAAAAIPLASDTFLRITLKNMIATWTNVDGKMDLPLNDFTATAIGMIRDNVAFDQFLYGDILYVGAAGLPGVAPYAPGNNDHYQQFEQGSFSFVTDLVAQTQTGMTGLDVAAGVLTTRGFGESFYSAGTNRRPVASTISVFLCREMEQMNDVTRPDPYVRRDVDRAPGGDPLAYRNKCVGCHSGMDPLTKAFSHFDFIDGAIIYDETAIPEKMIRNGNVFPGGDVPADDEWLNLWTQGQNSALGWNGPQQGNGPASYGRWISASDAFPTCMARRVFTKVCMRAPLGQTEELALVALGENFQSDGFQMKSLFTEVADYCIPE